MAEVSYLDFDLLIERSGENTYRARVLSSPAGQATAEIALPFSEIELENFLLRIGRPRRGVRRLESPEMEAAKTFGGKLFKAVFDDELFSCFRSSLDEARKKRQGLRIRLRLNDAPELVNLPWEYLYNPSLNRFLSLSVNTPLVRYLELPERISPLTITPPLKVLAMISSPSDFPTLDVEREWKNLNSALESLQERGLLVLDRLDTASPVELQYSLRRNEYHIFHFIGHGGFNEQAQDGILLFEDENGRGRPLSGQYLGTILHDEQTLRLAVLNACEGARSGSNDPFAGVAQSLVQQGLPAVIAMQFEVTDDAAIAFAREFYTAIAEGYPVDAAMGEARKAIFSLGNDIEWGTPVLYMRSPDGHVFDVDKTAVSKTQTIAEVPEKDIRRTTAKQPDARLEQLYTDALSAFWLQDWGKAWELFRQVVEIDPSYEDASERLETVKKQLTLSTLYNDAQRMIQDGDWKEATATLKRLVEQDPAYKDSPALLERAEKQSQLADLYDQARQLHETKHWQAVVNVFTQIHALQADYPDPDSLLASAQTEATDAVHQEKLQGLYRQALKAMDGSHWQEAVDLLVQIEDNQADYSDTSRLLERAQTELDKLTSQRQRKEVIEETYRQAGELLNTSQWRKALDAMEKVRELNPRFKDSQGIVAAAQQGIAQEDAEARHQQALVDQYDEAVRLLAAGEATRALETWEGLQAQSPGYPDPQNVAANASNMLRTASTTVSVDLPAAKPFLRRLPRRTLISLAAALGGIILCVVITGVVLNSVWSGLATSLEAPQSPAVEVTMPPTMPPEEPTEALQPQVFLPGVETIPLSQFQPTIPWLPPVQRVTNSFTETTVYAVQLLYLNPKEPPLDDLRVRQALAYAIDREALVAELGGLLEDPSPATSFLHPSLLGRDLYGAVGLPFDPDRAMQLLAEAGYPGGSGFPALSITSDDRDEYFVALEFITETWQKILGIEVHVRGYSPDLNTYIDTIFKEPPPVFRLKWYSFDRDPDILQMFATGNEDNVLKFSDAGYDRLVKSADQNANNPAMRQELYIQADQFLVEEQAILIPLYHESWVVEQSRALTVEITNIHVDQGRYVVEYQTYNYTERLPGQHVHFFFNTVPPDQAGEPGHGPWFVYGGPRPFTEYRVIDRPGGATQMCALVANPDHSVQPDSGNCVDLP